MSTEYQTLGRFVTRASGTGAPDIMIGVFLKNQEAIKENTVYEILNICGTLILKEVGESWIKDKSNNDVSWACRIDNVMEMAGNKMILTEKELSKVHKKYRS